MFLLIQIKLKLIKKKVQINNSKWSKIAYKIHINQINFKKNLKNKFNNYKISL